MLERLGWVLWAALTWASGCATANEQGLSGTAHAASPTAADGQTVAETPPDAGQPGVPQAPAEPLLCGVSRNEASLGRLITAEVGLGLLWLAGPQTEGVDEARRAVARALDLTHCLFDHRDPGGFERAVSEGHDSVETWFDTQFSGPDDDALLLSAGTAYFASLLTRAPFDAMFDVPIALSLLERAAARNPTAHDGLALLLLGAHDCYVPAQLGGRPERGSQRLRTVAALHGSLYEVAMVVEAELCTVGVQDRARFETLLAGVIEGGPDAHTGAFAQLAFKRATQLQDEADDLFLE